MQPDTQLIESIIRQVLSRIQEQPLRQSVLVLAYQRDVDQELLVKHILPGTKVDYLDVVKADMVCVSQNSYDQVILPSLSCVDMVDLALGRASGNIVEKVLSILLRGQPVMVIEFEYHCFKDTAPSALWDLYKSYEKTLAGYGLTQVFAVTGKSVVVQKRLVTEQEMADFVAQGVKKLTLSAGALVTALAIDMARKHQIEISRN